MILSCICHVSKTFLFLFQLCIWFFFNQQFYYLFNGFSINHVWHKLQRSVQRANCWYDRLIGQHHAFTSNWYSACRLTVINSDSLFCALNCVCRMTFNNIPNIFIENLFSMVFFQKSFVSFIILFYLLIWFLSYVFVFLSFFYCALFVHKIMFFFRY